MPASYYTIIFIEGLEDSFPIWADRVRTKCEESRINSEEPPTVYSLADDVIRVEETSKLKSSITDSFAFSSDGFRTKQSKPQRHNQGRKPAKETN